MAPVHVTFHEGWLSVLEGPVLAVSAPVQPDFDCHLSAVDEHSHSSAAVPFLDHVSELSGSPQLVLTFYHFLLPWFQFADGGFHLVLWIAYK